MTTLSNAPSKYTTWFIWWIICSQCNGVIQHGLGTSMPSQYLLEWYDTSPLFLFLHYLCMWRYWLPLNFMYAYHSIAALITYAWCRSHALWIDESHFVDLVSSFLFLFWLLQGHIDNWSRTKKNYYNAVW